MSAVASQDIRQKLAALDTLAASLAGEFDDAAEAAVGGVEGAGLKAASISERLDRLAIDRQILQRALGRATEAERTDADAKAAAERHAHRAVARGHAERLLSLARDIDAAHASLLPMLRELAEAERAVWDALRLAGAPPAGIVHGQRQLANLAMDRLVIGAQGKTGFISDQRPIADIARAAWRDLLETDGADNE